MAHLGRTHEDRIIELYRRGHSRRVVAGMVFVHPTTVTKVLKRRGVQARSRGGNQLGHYRLAHGEFERTVRMYQRGLSVGQVARLVGRAPNTIHYRLEQAGVQLRSSGEGLRLRHQTEPVAPSGIVRQRSHDHRPEGTTVANL